MNETIINLERELLNDEVRRSKERLNELISDDFLEFGASGKIFNKPEIIESLPNNINITHEGKDFEIIDLSDNTKLLTYKGNEKNHITGKERHTLRSSIWRRKEERWQIIFHQGTIC